jgi:hypothetical protein
VLREAGIGGPMERERAAADVIVAWLAIAEHIAVDMPVILDARDAAGPVGVLAGGGEVLGDLVGPLRERLADHRHPELPPPSGPRRVA